MAKKVEPLQYSYFEDTPFISRNRELNTKSYGLTDRALNNLSTFENPATQQAIVDKAYNSMWNDYNRNAQGVYNRNLARNYGRFGTSNATPAMYYSDTAQRNLNDVASRIASNAYGSYDQLVNNELNRRQSLLNNYYNIFNTTGGLTEEKDRQNYQIQLANEQAKYLADQQNKASVMERISNGVKGAMQGIGTGMMAGGPWGALAGGVLGGATGAMGSTGDGNAIGSIGGWAGDVMSNLRRNQSNPIDSSGSIKQGTLLSGGGSNVDPATVIQLASMFA